MISRISISLLSLCIMTGCQQDIGPTQEDIARLEKELRAGGPEEADKRDLLIDQYQGYYAQHPQDSISPYYMLYAADLLKETGSKGAEQALELYRVLQKNHTEHGIAAQALFMEAYVHDEKLREPTVAAERYERFLQEYPNHNLAPQARELLRLASDSLSMEERVQHWLQQEQRDSALN